MPRRRDLRVGAAVLLAVGVLGAALGAVHAAFTSVTANATNTLAANPDLVAPTVPSAVVGKSLTGAALGSVPGYVKSGGTYHLYANVADTGNPASGISPSDVTAVTANTSTFDTGVTAVALADGSFTYGGVAYNRRSAELTANTTGGGLVDATAYAFSAFAKDQASPVNSATTSGFSVTADTVQPTTAGPVASTVNGAGVVNRPTAGDTVNLVYSEPIDPASILAGWTGATTNVVVRINQASGSDTMTFYAPNNTTLLNLGTLALGSTAYVTANGTFGLTGTASTMTHSNGTITLVLGTQAGTTVTVATNVTLAWTRSASAYDRAGNAAITTAANEAAPADPDF